MKSSMLFMLVLFVVQLFEFGNCLRCYQCYSTKSAEDCSIDSSEVDCDSNRDVCYKSARKLYGVTIHKKGCVTKAQCEPYSLCGANVDDDTCKLKCCGSFKCNKSSTAKGTTCMIFGVIVLVSMMLLN